MGNPYTAGNGHALAFDSNGLPWVRYSTYQIVTLDADKRIVKRNTSSTVTYWEDSSTTAINVTPHVTGTATNFALKDAGNFFIGNYRNANSSRTAANVPIMLKYLDYGNNAVVNIMGVLGTDAAAPDVATAGAVQGTSLPLACANGQCYLQYRADQDRLYFSEETRIRYVTTPTNPATSTLTTLFTAGGNIFNFIFSPDGSQVFYVRSNGLLYCHDLSSGKAWCNDTSLGPPSPLSSIVGGANQLTWENSTSLLISSYRGYIYRYALPP
jgi:hypothetical protein